MAKTRRWYRRRWWPGKEVHGRPNAFIEAGGRARVTITETAAGDVGRFNGFFFYFFLHDPDPSNNEMIRRGKRAEKENAKIVRILLNEKKRVANIEEDNVQANTYKRNKHTFYYGIPTRPRLARFTVHTRGLNILNRLL